MPAQTPRYGTELTRFDPVVHDDGNGGQMIRFITDDGHPYWRILTPEAAARLCAKLALFVAKDIAASER